VTTPQAIAGGLFQRGGWALLKAGSWVTSPSYHRLVRRGEKRATEWLGDPANEDRLVDFKLDPDALVFDVGGFEGNWASDIYSRFRCEVQVFEPVAAFAERIERRFAANPSISVHPFGLGGRDETAEIQVAGDGSSTLIERAEIERGDTQRQSVEIRDTSDYVSGLGRDVDLIKLNIEGAEFDLLDRLLDTGEVRRIGYVLVQFHETVPDAEARREHIISRLAETHEPMWQFPFVWECWQRRC
jgi:FkbM family methyltransferase